MRSLFASLFIALATAATADIARPDTLSDTLDLMLERLLPTYPDAAIDPANQNITLGATDGGVINGDNLHAVLQTSANDAEREAALERFVTTMIAATTAEPIEGPLPLDTLYPVLRHQSFAQSGASMGLYSEPFIGDMVRVYAIDSPDYVSYVTTDHFDDGLTLDALHAAAARNLAAKVEITRFEQNGDVIVLYTDGFYESSLLLDANLWRGFVDLWDEDIAMIVPARDVVIFAPAGDANAVALLDLIRDDVLTNGTHQLSDLTYIWRDDAWQLLPR